jgi:hypothetical protein
MARSRAQNRVNSSVKIRSRSAAPRAQICASSIAQNGSISGAKKKQKQRRASAEDVARMFCLRDSAHFSVTDVAETLKFSESAVRYWLKKGAKTAQQRRVSPQKQRAVKERRQKTAALTREVTVVRGKRCVKFPSTRAIRDELRRGGKKTSRSTVRRDLIACGITARVRPKTPVRACDFARRLRFARRYAGEDARNWVFSDEKLFTSNDYSNRFQWVSNPTQIILRQTQRFPDGRLMVWGAIGVNYRELVVFPPNFRLDRAAYVRRCLSRGLVQHCLTNDLRFMHDGASCHTSSRSYLLRKNVRVVEDWPPHSPDLNPIETLWAILSPRVSKLGPRNCEELESAIRTEWAKVKVRTINGLVTGFAGRLAKMRKRRSGAPSA